MKHLNYLSVILFIFFVNVYANFREIGDKLMCHDDSSLDRQRAGFVKHSFPEEKKVFFLHTSCHTVLNYKQACSVESVARHNRDWTVYVLFAAHLPKYSPSSFTYNVLIRYKNVKLGRINVREHAKGTILQSMFKIIRNQSEWPVEHTAEALKYLFLYKYGGVYLDLDMLVFKSLNSLGDNWVATQYREEDAIMPGLAAIRISKDEVGRNFSRLLMRKFAVYYEPAAGEAEGMALIYRALSKMCNSTELTAMDSELCTNIQIRDNEEKHKNPGIHILPPQYFYPVRFTDYHKLYNRRTNFGAAVDFTNSYGVHIWANRLKSHFRMRRSSLYSQLASKYCPYIYQSAFEVVS